MSIILTGYMGCGKSTVGSQLSEHLQIPFLDSDKEIELQQGCSISDLFAIKGESYFRRLETEFLEQLQKCDENVILSTGGGMPLSERNQELFHKIGTVVYLKTSPKTIYTRVKNDTKRPLLQCDDPYGKICTMLQEREPAYEKGADIILTTDQKTILSLVKEIETAADDFLSKNI